MKWSFSRLIAVAAVLTMAAGVFSQSAQSQTASASTDYCWIDAKTGKQVPTAPASGPNHGGATVSGSDAAQFDPQNPNRASTTTSGKTFVHQPDGSWIDAQTGQAVPTAPASGANYGGATVSGSDTAQFDPSNPNRASTTLSGRTFIRVPCSSPSSDVNTTGGPLGHDGQSPPPKTTPPPATPTHRQTTCASCQKAADRLNKASDQLAQDLADPAATPETIADDRSLVKDYSLMLDDCEKHCKDSSGLLDHVTIGVGVDVGGGHDHRDDHHDHNDHHSEHSDVP